MNLIDELAIASRTYSWEQFKKEYAPRVIDSDKSIYEAMSKSKCGYIIIEKTSSNFGYLREGETERGVTQTFGEGLALFISNPHSDYHTSIIKKITWKDTVNIKGQEFKTGSFKTLNSTYNFKFMEYKPSILVKVVKKTTNALPEYTSLHAAGCDVRANLEESITINPGERKLVPTGLFVSIPEGYEIQVRPRSGLALKKGITVLNTPGTIDADYRGEIGVILINLGTEPFVVEKGERIGQLILNKVEQISWKEVETLDETERGEGGFGHSGVK